MLLETLYLIGFIFLCFTLEYFFPRKAFSFKIQDLKEDILWFVSNQIVLNLAFGLITFNLGSYLMRNFTGLISLNNFTQSNIFVEFILYILIFDFISYTGHLLLHKIPFLWNFHKLHHSITTLNPISAFRHSVYEKAYYSFYFALLTSVFSVDKKVYLSAILVTFGACILQHSRVKISFLSFMSYLFITPKNHMYHHSKTNFLNSGQNFGFIFVFWDKLFRTFYIEDHDDIELGVNDEKFPESFTKRFTYPL
jgi:sterol desaturase/sphingolipid hydroxylase (fatty acid hydroxylase superfamily)